MAINVTTTGTITASVTAATISFTAPDTIADSGSGFGVFAPGDYIVISGSASNDGARKIVTATAATLTVEAVTNVNALTAELAGASVTIAAGVGLNEYLNDNYLAEPLVLVHPTTYDLRGTAGWDADKISRDALLGAAIDGGDVTMEVDGKAVATGVALLTIGSGFVGDDAGAEDLAATLVAGNTSGGTALQMSTTDQIQLGGTLNHMENGGTGNFTFTTNKAFDFNNADSQIFLQNFGNLSLNKPSTSDNMTMTPGGGSIGYVGTGIGSSLDMKSALSGATKTWTMPNATGTVALTSDLTPYQLTSEKGSANGYASLDGSGKVPTSELPVQMMEFEGNWNATTNTPTLANTDTGKQGTVYRVSVAGSQDFGAGSISFVIGDWVYNTGSVWEKGENSNPSAEDLAATLVVGNTSGGTDVVMSNQDKVQFNVATKTIGELSAGGPLGYASDKGHKFTTSTATTAMGALAFYTENSAAGSGRFTMTYGSGLLQYLDNDTSFFGGLDLFSGLTASRSWAMPDAGGTVALTSDLAVQATESVAGIAEIATQAETDAGTDDMRIVTPLKLATYAGSQSIKRVTVADTATSIAAGDTITAYTSITATRIATLPLAASVTVGQIYRVKDESGSVIATITEITVDGNGAETIDGVASLTISQAYGFVAVYSDGSNWFTV